MSFDELLSMELWQLYAYEAGYLSRAREQKAYAAESGFWSAYFTWSKRPKKLQTIIEEILTSGDKAASKAQSSLEFDKKVAEFKERERRRLGGGSQVG